VFDDVADIHSMESVLLGALFPLLSLNEKSPQQAQPATGVFSFRSNLPGRQSRKATFRTALSGFLT